jgi:ABC-type transporter Mla subunit MlaD
VAVRVQRSDFYVGLFLVATIALVVAALIATAGWGIDRNDIYVRTNDATAITVDTKVFMQGMEVGRVAAITPRPTGQRLEFIIRLSVLAQFEDGSDMRFPTNTIAQVVTSILGAPTLNLVIDTARAATGFLGATDTIVMERTAPAMEAFGALANDLKGEIQEAIGNANRLMVHAASLADSIAYAAGTSRRFLAGIAPGTEKTLSNAAAALERMRVLLDSTTNRSGVTLAQVNAVLEQSRLVMVSADSLTRLLTAMGGESRPEVAIIIQNMRYISEQMQYVLEQLGRRPMRAITGVRIPDTLTVEGRARRDSLRADSARQRAAPPPSATRASADSVPRRDSTANAPPPLPPERRP